ncbi:MAG: hypothetical protein JRJ85_08805 [Deltaproteobacteria bacterium]|nr:hypothetical protein [Deltaproteobacteria bacterium]
MKNRLLLVVSAVLFILCVSGVAGAAMLTGDFYTRYSGWGTFDEHQSIEVDITDAIEHTDNPGNLTHSGFMYHPQVDMDLNPDNNTLTLTPREIQSFHVFEAWIENIVFDNDDYIEGISAVQSGSEILPVTPSLTYSQNSIHKEDSRHSRGSHTRGFWFKDGIGHRDSR